VSDVVFEARPNFYGLGLGLETFGFGLSPGIGPDLGFESCIDNFLASRSNSRKILVIIMNK